MAFTPANMILYMHATYGEVPDLHWGRLASSIVVAVVAICAGLCISCSFPLRRSCFNFIGNIAGIVLIVFSALVSSTNDPIWDKDRDFYVAVALPCFCAIFFVFPLSKGLPCLTLPESVAVTVEACYQNT